VNRLLEVQCSLTLEGRERWREGGDSTNSIQTWNNSTGTLLPWPSQLHRFSLDSIR